MSIFIAIDHQDKSIRKFLDFVPSKDAISTFRRTLGKIALNNNINGIVVSLDDFIWFSRLVQKQRLILGLPDFNTLDNAQIRLNKYLSTLDTKPTFLKLGFSVRNKKDLSTDNISNILNSFGKDFNWILEPYFHFSLDVTQREAFLKSLAKNTQVHAFKLDLDDPEKCAKIYTKASLYKPWYSRSDGLVFSEFFERLKIASDAGCNGVIAGGAIWGDLVENIINSNHLELSEQLISSRILKLKGITNKK
jgi:hypothetical protein